MTLQEIKSAVESGKTVCWETEGYEVRKSESGKWNIVSGNGYCIGLTWTNGTTMNGQPEEFFIKGEH